jgi:hypothetical protein
VRLAPEMCGICGGRTSGGIWMKRDAWRLGADYALELGALSVMADEGSCGLAAFVSCNLNWEIPLKRGEYAKAWLFYLWTFS